MKLHLLLISVSLVTIAGTCDYTDSRLKIKNNSKNAIAFDYSIDTVLEERSNENIAFFLRDKILPGETSLKTKPGSTNGWPFLIQKSLNKKLNIFIIEVDTLVKYNDWGYIRKNRLYRRYELTEDELNKKNWIVEYP
ncbi:hypothetical protein DSECCO2_625520 [anaerobic digester metagenome]